MKVVIKPGKYVVAVSGGVDSMVLLDLLSNLAGVGLIVAHFNHGIREDSDLDEKLVVTTAKNHGLPVEVGRGGLGVSTSEDEARRARYEFLNSVKEKYDASAIITAHHQDDLIETALINILRGSGPQGLVAMASNPNIVRPLLGVTKKDIYDYARTKNLVWREDTTNAQDHYLRNYIRLKVIPKMTAQQRQQILDNIQKISVSKKTREQLLAQLSESVCAGGKINRAKFANLPNIIGDELLVHWLRQRGVRDFDKHLIGRTNVLIRTAAAGTEYDLKNGLKLHVTKLTVQFGI